MLVSSNTFDNSTFLYKQLKFTWLVWVAIAVDVGGEIDAVGTQSRFTTPIASLFPDPKFLMNRCSAGRLLQLEQTAWSLVCAVADTATNRHLFFGSCDCRLSALGIHIIQL
jgi:hypothetical protein